MCRGVPAASAAEPPSMRARCRRQRPHARAARGCVREKNLENSCAIRNASSFARTRASRRRRRRDPSMRFGSAPAAIEKSLRRAADFAPQHMICAKSRAAATAGETRSRPRGGMHATSIRVRWMPVAETEPAACAAGSECSVKRREGVSAPLPRAVRRSRRGRGVRSTARVPRPPPRTASRRRRRLR